MSRTVARCPGFVRPTWCEDAVSRDPIAGVSARVRCRVVRAVDIIERKRTGAELREEELAFLVRGFLSGDVPDYQMSAFTMAVLWRGLTTRETATLTRLMIASGDTVDLGAVGRPTVDKHSTGGVGDKTTLVVGPVAAALGAAVPKLSGRGLGHTGGTIDKLEAIPGFRTDLSIDDLVRVASDVGLAVASPTARLVPADQRLYALRDATATVPSLGLIVSSIMSKKLAVATDAIVLDVKVGAGAFFATPAEARAFAEAAVALGESFHRRVHCVLTSMSHPLGRAIGNALEIREAIAVLHGGGPADLIEVCTAVAAEMVVAAGLAPDRETAAIAVTASLRDGRAWDAFRRFVTAQGGDLEAFEGAPAAERRIDVAAPATGWLVGLDAAALGRVAMALGAGRERKDDSIDPAAGITLHCSVGDYVEAGQPILSLATNRGGDPSGWVDAAVSAVGLAGRAPLPQSPIIDVLCATGALAR